MQTRTALVFDGTGCRSRFEEILDEAVFYAHGCFFEPTGVDYILTPDDDYYTAVNWLRPAADVGVCVLVLVILAGCPDDIEHDTLIKWSLLKQMYEVRGTYSAGPLSDQYIPAALQELAVEIAFSGVSRRQLEIAISVEPPNRPAQATENSWQTHRRNRQAYGGMITRGQRESAERRQATSWHIDWNCIDTWVAPDQSGEPVAYLILGMADKHLWETVNWLVANCLALCKQQPESPTVVELINAKRWLSVQPIFRALIQEALRRKLTFSADVFRYLRDYVVGQSESLQVTVPWADPAASDQINELASFLAEPVVPPKVVDPLLEYGRDYREIDLD